MRPLTAALAALVLAACGGGSDVPAAPAPTSVVPLPAAFTISEGEVAPLAAVVLPDPGVDQAVRWSSSDLAVATVNGSGTAWSVRGRARGNAQLTVTSVQDPARSATVALTVEKPATLAFDPISPPFVIDPVAQVLHTTLKNIGDRPATGVSLVVAHDIGGAGWLQAVPAAGASLDLAAGAQVTLDVAVDPAGLATGLHAAALSPVADPGVYFAGNAYTVVLRVP